MSPIIEVENVTKEFTLYSNPPRSFKTVLVDTLRGKFSLGEKQHFRALNSINFSIMPGEFVGIMGRNGAGKSTLLKLISGIYAPTSGKITVRGLIAPLIEVGAGFHSDLTGEENIYLNASILGFGRKAAQSTFKDIVEFSELGEFLRRPVRTYSSGMIVRLGFSIAVHLDAPILLLDEVLAVGDASFQAKCLKKVHDLHSKGRTIIFITHDPHAVANNCTRCIVIEKHEKIYDGRPGTGAHVYQQLMAAPQSV